MQFLGKVVDVPVVVQRQVPIGFSWSFATNKVPQIRSSTSRMEVAIILSGGGDCDVGCDFAVKRGILRTPSTRT